MGKRKISHCTYITTKVWYPTDLYSEVLVVPLALPSPTFTPDPILATNLEAPQIKISDYATVLIFNSLF